MERRKFQVKKFTLEHILEIEEGLRGVKDIKAKIEERFGQTDRQKDLETRTRFLGLKLEGDVTDFCNYVTRERKKFVESLQHPGLPNLPENTLDKWMLKKLIEDLREQNRIDQREFEVMEKSITESKI